MFGFDLISLPKSEKISAGFLDYSPTVMEFDWSTPQFKVGYELPDWTEGIFSNKFVACRPDEDEYDTLFNTAYNMFDTMLNKLDSTNSITEDTDTINEIIKTGILPDEYDFIALTYSQLAARKSGLKKYEYLIEAANNSKGGKYIIVMDECHNATGTKSKTGEKIRGLVTQSSGCLFSSATFSKTPENMYLYSLKNDLRKANVSTKELLDIIKKGGERLIENMAASLAQSGQLLRRERRFDNCNVEYEFMKMEDKDSIFEKYDKTLSLYRELLAYFNLGNTAFYNARKKSIERFAELKKVEL
jgi:tetratricopeptide (TPR) repeat protein